MIQNKIIMITWFQYCLLVSIVFPCTRNKKQEPDQLAARELLQQCHKDVPILDIPKKIMDLNRWVTLGGKGKKCESRVRMRQFLIMDIINSLIPIRLPILKQMELDIISRVFVEPVMFAKKWNVTVCLSDCMTVWHVWCSLQLTARHFQRRSTAQWTHNYLCLIGSLTYNLKKYSSSTHLKKAFSLKCKCS